MPTRTIESANGARLVSLEQHSAGSIQPSPQHGRRPPQVLESAAGHLLLNIEGATSARRRPQFNESSNIALIMAPDAHPVPPPPHPMLKPVPSAAQGITGTNAHGAVPAGESIPLMQNKQRAAAPPDAVNIGSKFLGSRKGRVDPARNPAAGAAPPVCAPPLHGMP